MKSVGFNEAVAENMMIVLSPCCKTEIRGFFTDYRVDPGTVPEGWRAYEFRTNGCGNICTLEERVAVNFGGTFLTRREVPMKNGYRSLSGRGGYTFAYPKKRLTETDAADMAALDACLAGALD